MALQRDFSAVDDTEEAGTASTCHRRSLRRLQPVHFV
jgi:hypothetical protein